MSITLPSIDKQAHFWAGLAITSTVYIITNELSYSVAIAAIAAFLREVLGNKDKLDFLYTILGAFLSFVVITYLQNIL